MKIFPCSEKQDEFPLTWDGVIKHEGIYADADDPSVRVVVYETDCAFLVHADEPDIEHWSASVRRASKYRRLDNAKLCLEIRE